MVNAKDPVTLEVGVDDALCLQVFPEPCQLAIPVASLPLPTEQRRSASDEIVYQEHKREPGLGHLLERFSKILEKLVPFCLDNSRRGHHLLVADDLRV